MLVACLAIEPAAQAACGFGLLQSEWRQLVSLVGALSPTIAKVRHRARIEPLSSREMVTYNLNRVHPIEGLDPNVRFDAITEGHEIRDAAGKTWKVTTLLDNDANIVAQRSEKSKTLTRKFPTQPAQVLSDRYRITVDGHPIEIAIPVGAPPKTLSELRASISQLPRNVIASLGYIRVNLQPYQFNSFKRTILKDFTRAAATAHFADGRGVVDYYPEAYKNRKDAVTILRHEFGHLMAHKIYGQAEPDAEWIAAMKEDGDNLPSSQIALSLYARNSATEDFAEAVEAYLSSDGGAMGNGGIRRTYAKRFAILDRHFKVDPAAKLAAREAAGEWAGKRTLAAAGLLLATVTVESAVSVLGKKPVPTPTPTPTP